MEKEVIYIELLNEGTNVWRPVEAIKLKDNIYKIGSIPPYILEDEELKFKEGELVICEKELKGNDWLLVAVRKADSQSN